MPFQNRMTGRHITQRRYWSDAEVQQLLELAGDMPFPLVQQQFNYWATKNGLPHRSRDSLAKKLNGLGGSRQPVGQWVGTGDVAKMLGKNKSTIQLWVRAGYVRRHKAGPFSSIRRADLVKLARERPRLFAGCDRTNLLMLLEDEELVTSILQQYPRRYWAMGRGRRVRWVDTGQVFDCYKAAARAAHVSDKTICKALQEGRLAAGWRFELVA